MELTFLGGAREVGRNCILLREAHNELLLDCGVKIGEHEEHPLLTGRDMRRLKHIAISHAHLDHVGYLPFVYSRGCAAQIHMTKPTRDLMQLLLSDYMRIKEGREEEAEEEEIKFGHEAVTKVLTHCHMYEYGEASKTPLPLTFYNAGHILGSACTLVQGSRRLLYTSDINTREGKLLEPAQQGIAADALVIESTYGAKADAQPSFKKACQLLVSGIKETLDKGGKVLIPSFAVGRGQEILMILESYMRSGGLPRVPIFVDGMITKANRIYRQNVIYMRDEVKMRILMSADDPFASPLFHVPKSKSKREVFESGSAIIVSTSGMLSGGPVLTYLKKLADNEQNKLMLVGYQAEGTRGRKLLEGQKHLRIGNTVIDVNMQVVKAPFSAHADHASLVQYAKSVKGVKKIFIIHGEHGKPEELAQDLQRQIKNCAVEIPENGRSYQV